MAFRPRFSPMPVLTLVVLIALAILIKLGTWQYQRLGWKTDLIAQVEQAANAPAFDRLSSASDALSDETPIDFRRIEVQGQYVQNADGTWPVFFIYTPLDSKTYWTPYRPFTDGSQIVFIADEPVSDGLKSAATPPDVLDLHIAGYVRLARGGKRVGLSNSPEQNRWFSFNPEPQVLDWGQALAGKSIETRYYINPVYRGAQPSQQTLPVKVPEIRNNHFDYMLTWYSFAIILLIIYLIMHRRAGRLSFKG